jgi:hypothetical protein
VVAVEERHELAREHTGPPRPSGRAWWWLVALTISPLLLSAVLLLAGVGGRYRPAGDYASIELQIRDVGRHPVLLGLFSREDWHHPGPALFYVLAIPYRLLGSSSAAADAGALLVNASAVVAMAWLARRRGGTSLMFCMLVGSAVLMRSFGRDFLRSTWNPTVPVIPYGVMLLLTWCMASGDGWAVPAGAGVATFLVQAHVGYAALAFPLWLGGTIAYVVRARSRHEQRSMARMLGVTGAVLFVTWLPAVIDQFAGRGNLSSTYSYFAHPDGPTHSFVEGWRMVTGEFGWRSEWIAGPPRAPFFLAGVHPYSLHAPAPVLLLPFVAAVVICWRRRDASALWFAAVIVASTALGILAVMRTIGPLEAYRLQWTWTNAMFALVFVAWVAWTLVASRWHWIEGRVLIPVAVVAIAALTIASAVDAVHVRAPDPPGINATMESIGKQLAKNVPAGGHGVVVVKYATAEGEFWWEPGIVLALEQHGVPVRVATDPVDLLGDHRLVHDARVRQTLVVMEGQDAVVTPPGAKVVAYWGTGPRDELARDMYLLDLLEGQHSRGEISDAEYLTRKVTLGQPHAVAVYDETNGG